MIDFGFVYLFPHFNGEKKVHYFILKTIKSTIKKKVLPYNTFSLYSIESANLKSDDQNHKRRNYTMRCPRSTQHYKPSSGDPVPQQDKK